MTIAKPPARYGAIGGARPGRCFDPPSYTASGDTTTTMVAAQEDLYELHSRLERICRELRPKLSWSLNWGEIAAPTR
ncbi:hypothetical protein [Bradyrhizobium sp. JR3.5]